MITALLAGSNTVGESPLPSCRPSTLYDFTSEELGSNSVLKLPASSFRYLHIKLSAGILSSAGKGATVYNLEETRRCGPMWDHAGRHRKNSELP